jgi:hypothetical protein
MATETSNPPEIAPDDPFRINDNLMAVREFLDTHNAINTPWFRIRFFFALWRERIGDWFRCLLQGKIGAGVADSCGSDEKCPSETHLRRS